MRPSYATWQISTLDMAWGHSGVTHTTTNYKRKERGCFYEGARAARVWSQRYMWAATTITRVRNSLVGEYSVRGIVRKSRIVRKEGERLDLEKEKKR